MTKNIIFLTLVFFISNFSAQNGFKEFYFPIGTKKEVKVYKYVDKNNIENIEYWKVTTNPKTNKVLTESYTTDFRLYNIFEETIKDYGAEVIRYADFYKNDSGENIRIDGIVVDKDVYKWKDENKYKYSIKYKHPKYGNELFIKQRKKNNFEKINVNGTDYSTIRFMDEYEIKSLDSNQNYQYYQFTYYANGIGMVKYKRYHPDDTVIELELTEILTEREFNKLIKKASR